MEKAMWYYKTSWSSNSFVVHLELWSQERWVLHDFCAIWVLRSDWWSHANPCHNRLGFRKGNIMLASSLSLRRADHLGDIILNQGEGRKPRLSLGGGGQWWSYVMTELCHGMPIPKISAYVSVKFGQTASHCTLLWCTGPPIRSGLALQLVLRVDIVPSG
jgi:hypothetical protein